MVGPIPQVKPADMMGLLRTEVALREHTQREMALRENLEGLLKVPTTRNLATRIQVQYLQVEISDLSRKYWRLEREWWKIRTSFMDGLLTRGIEGSIIGAHNQSGICIVCFAMIVLGGQVAVPETADAAIVTVGDEFRLAIAQ